jgi:hypothetical protein
MTCTIVRSDKFNIPYILKSNLHSVFGDFLNGKNLVRGSNLHLSFNCPFAHRAIDWIILDVTIALKSDAIPGADESYWYCEAGLSQQACAILSETSSHRICWNMEGAYSNLLCTVVMEEECQKSKRLHIWQSSVWSYSVCGGEAKLQSHGNFWSWWK